MKKINLVLICLVMSLSLAAQSPQSFSYQAVVRDAAGAILSMKPVEFEMSILTGSINGSIVYSEKQTANSGEFGLVNFEIGNGTILSGNFSTIDWGNGSKFLEVKMVKLDGSAVNLVLGTMQLLSVPYALFAEKTAQTYDAGTGLKLTNQTFEAKNTEPLWNANKLQNVIVSSNQPLLNQFLMFNGEVWIPINLPQTPTPSGSNAQTLIYTADGF